MERPQLQRCVVKPAAPLTPAPSTEAVQPPTPVDFFSTINRMHSTATTPLTISPANRTYYKVTNYICRHKELTIVGKSIGGIATGFFIPEIQLCLDAGLCEDFSPQTILVTH